jgi:leucine dehydrogenase
MSFPSLTHEHVVVARGSRSGLAITVAVHSTALGTALGGCRVWQYGRWSDGLADALRLSAAMTLKCAAAGLRTGGGKSVIALEPGESLIGDRRRAALLDLGDLVDGLGGRYRTAEDVGTGTEDMLVVRERTPYVVGLPHDDGGVGEPAEPTARGVLSAIDVVAGRLGLPLRGLRVTIAGLGQVGTRLARSLAADGAVLTVSDVDDRRRRAADELSARWADPGEALALPADIVVPAGVGGVLDAATIEALDARAVVGPANNQLAEEGLDRLLAERGILWAPDFIVNAGGALATILAEVERLPAEEVWRRIDGIGATLERVLDDADVAGTTPLDAAVAMAERRLGEAAVAAR